MLDEGCNTGLGWDIWPDCCEASTFDAARDWVYLSHDLGSWYREQSRGMYYFFSKLQETQQRSHEVSSSVLEVERYQYQLFRIDVLSTAVFEAELRSSLTCKKIQGHPGSQISFCPL
jgi:hypothetical protein